MGAAITWAGLVKRVTTPIVLCVIIYIQSVALNVPVSYPMGRLLSSKN